MEEDTRPVISLTRGSASLEEITALALVLVARTPAPAPPGRRAARWRSAPYGVAHSWRNAS